MASEFWLSDAQWAAMEPHLPTNQPGPKRKDDRRVISGIVHMLKHGGRWQDVPACYGPPTTIYNRYHRWSQRGIWAALLAALTHAIPGGLQLIDSTTAKAHRCAAGAKGGPTRRLSAARAEGAAPRCIS
jgi:transposase